MLEGKKIIRDYPYFRVAGSPDILRDEEYIPYTDRSWSELKDRLFPETPWQHRSGWQQVKDIWLGRTPPRFVKVEGDHWDYTKECPPTEIEFFSPGTTILEIGSGQGTALGELAVTYPKCTFIGIDRALTKVHLVDHPAHSNLSLIANDWRQLSLADQSVNRILCPYSVLFHNGVDNEDLKEVTRVAQQGTILRGNYNFAWPEFGEMYAQMLSDLGWEVWVLRAQEVIVARKL